MPSSQPTPDTNDDNPGRAGDSTFRGVGVWWAVVVGTISLIAIIALVIQNGEKVRLEWLWLDITASLAVVVLATVALTLATSLLVGVVWRHRRRTQLK